jgi:hypothetical protein
MLGGDVFSSAYIQVSECLLLEGREKESVSGRRRILHDFAWQTLCYSIKPGKEKRSPEETVRRAMDPGGLIECHEFSMQEREATQEKKIRSLPAKLERGPILESASCIV